MTTSDLRYSCNAASMLTLLSSQGAGVLVNITDNSLLRENWIYTSQMPFIFESNSRTAHIVETYQAKIANYSSRKAAYPNAMRNADFRR